MAGEGSEGGGRVSHSRFADFSEWLMLALRRGAVTAFQAFGGGTRGSSLFQCHRCFYVVVAFLSLSLVLVLLLLLLLLLLLFIIISIF